MSLLDRLLGRVRQQAVAAATPNIVAGAQAVIQQHIQRQIQQQVGAPPFPSPTTARVVGVSDYANYCHVSTFDIKRGEPGVEYLNTVVPSGDNLVLQRFWASAVGAAEDVSELGIRASVTLRCPSLGKDIASHVLNSLYIETVRSSELEERVIRLEQLIAFLSEQETPAAEALRRLGGGKIDLDTPTRFARPALITKGGDFSVRLSIDENAPRAIGPVLVKVSVAGVEKRSVA